MEDLDYVNTINQNIAIEEIMTKKIKILTLGDMPFSPSGVGTQTKYIIEALLKTGKFIVRSLGGAMKHPNHDPIKTKEFENDWIVFPVDGYGNQEIIRSIIHFY